MNSGVYQIRNLINDKRYVGSAVNLKMRKKKHLRSLRAGKHQAKLQNAWDKYGEAAFIFEVIEFTEGDKLSRLLREQYWMDFYSLLGPGTYNIFPEARSPQGVKRGPMSKEQRIKLSIVHSGVVRGPCSPETRLKISLSNTGKKRSAEIREKYSKSQTGRIGGGMQGKHHSAEARRKVSIGNKNYRFLKRVLS